VLITETVKVKPGCSVKHYLSKGYVIPPIIDNRGRETFKNSIIEVKVEDLLPNSLATVKIRCDYCENEFETSYANHINGRKFIEKDACSNCKSKKTIDTNIARYGTNSIKERGKILGFKVGRNSHDGNKVYNDFISAGLEPLFKPEDYINMNQKLPYICPNHRDKGTLYIDYDNFVNKGARCKHCGMEHSQDYKRYTYEFCLEKFKEKGYELLDKIYINCDTNMSFICTKHKDKGIQKATLFSILNYEDSCIFCKSKKLSGENHWHWKGGISNLAEHLRILTSTWRNESLKANNYRCALTNSNGHLVVHHLYSFSNIVNETLICLDMPLKTEMSEYNPEDLKLIEDKCLELHYKYGLGVLLTPIIHDLFHQQYGYDGNTSPEDFEEFKQRYNSHEFDKILCNN